MQVKIKILNKRLIMKYYWLILEKKDKPCYSNNKVF